MVWSTDRASYVRAVSQEFRVAIGRRRRTPSQRMVQMASHHGAALRRQRGRRRAQHAAPAFGGRGNLVGSYDQTLSVVLTVYGNWAL
jgi:hypothetical protein